MRSRSCVLLLALAVAGACGKEIGDECLIASDCDPNGTRSCDDSLPGGYCTMQGCDFNTCPEESACIRFYTGHFENLPCESHEACSFDERCSLAGFCVPRNSEIRYCMRTCEESGDCRDGYECRTIELMKAHGGEPVLAPGAAIDASAPKFCAPAPG